jgi:hypothetical protein
MSVRSSMTPRPTRPNGENVKVTVRCRPINSGQAKCWEVDPEQQKVMSMDGRLRSQEYQFGKQSFIETFSLSNRLVNR